MGERESWQEQTLFFVVGAVVGRCVVQQDVPGVVFTLIAVVLGAFYGKWRETHEFRLPFARRVAPPTGGNGA